MSDVFPDHYAALLTAPDATPEQIRSAFRARILEAHPDKAGQPVDPERLARVMRAFEVLGDALLREDYDRSLELRRRHEEPASSIPHIIDSDRPFGRARAILYLLVNDRVGEALGRLREIGDGAVSFLEKNLEHGEFVDSGFLVAEALEKHKLYGEALYWYQEIIRAESSARRQRPCYPELLERAKKLLIHRLQGGLEARASLEYLRRAELLGLTRPERFEVYKRRAQCYLEMDMNVEAARNLQLALDLTPNAKGVQRLKDALRDYL